MNAFREMFRSLEMYENTDDKRYEEKCRQATMMYALVALVEELRAIRCAMEPPAGLLVPSSDS